MHPEHRMLLTKAAMSRPTDSSSLQKKVKALESLIAGLDVKGNEVARTAAKEELVRVIRIAARLGTARSQAASSMAGRLLSELDSSPCSSTRARRPASERRGAIGRTVSVTPTKAIRTAGSSCTCSTRKATVTGGVRESRANHLGVLVLCLRAQRTKTTRASA